MLGLGDSEHGRRGKETLVLGKGVFEHGRVVKGGIGAQERRFGAREGG